MTLTRVEVRNRRGGTLPLPLGDISSGFRLEDVEGLDPVKAVLVSTSFANLDGEEYQSARREARDIKLKLGIETGNSQNVRQLRTKLYEYFMPKTVVMLRFVHTDGLSVDIQGMVEDFEAPLFVKEPTVEIPIRCFNPDFYDPNVVTLRGMSVSETELPSGRLEIDYPGTVDTGLIFKITANRPMGEFTIYHGAPDGTLRTLEFSYPLLSNDVLTISTVPGTKYVTLLRNGVASSALYGMSPASNWVALQPGENRLRLYAEGEGVPFTIEYTTKYGGL